MTIVGSDPIQQVEISLNCPKCTVQHVCFRLNLDLREQEHVRVSFPICKTPLFQILGESFKRNG